MYPEVASYLPGAPVSGLARPDSNGRSFGRDWELGARADAVRLDLRSEYWESRVVDGVFEIRTGNGPWTTILTREGALSEFSFSFDQNMRPIVAYSIDGVVYIYWYDFTVPGFVDLSVGAASNPMLTFDYPMDSSQPFSEVLLFFVSGPNIKYRRQSDRFTIEYTYSPLPAGKSRITGAGMGTNWRYHIRVR